MSKKNQKALLDRSKVSVRKVSNGFIVSFYGGDAWYMPSTYHEYVAKNIDDAITLIKTL